MWTLTREAQQALTPDDAIKLLIEGNKRFVNNLKLNRNLLQQVNETANGQYPFAVILSCIDSRTSAELIFDQGLGDIFSIRIAGNIINDDILGSMEFACKIAGSKLIAVMGHTKCGAIQGACQNVKLGYLTGLLDKIQPAVDFVKKSLPHAQEEAQFLNQVARANVELVMQTLPEKSPILKELIEQEKLKVVGGLYDAQTGEFNFDRIASTHIHQQYEAEQENFLR